MIMPVTRTLRLHATMLGALLAAMWLTFGVDQLLGGALDGYGVRPRTVDGLTGILYAPFLHGSLQHITSNSVPFLVLGWLVMLRDVRHFVAVTVVATLTSGLCAWAFAAPNSVTIGASGVIFGYLGFLVFGGLFARTFWPILLSVGVTALWGGLVFGVLPNQPGISWQAHLGGFIGGALMAKWAARRATRGRAA